ncbi:MAG: PIG-L deacetylase family protein [Vicinamibacterales bacterium]|nr:PIG-L deacetylase family protein [Vicinamibacterales bacterium]
MRSVPEGGGRSVLVVAPHADDEVLGCGGTIQHLRADGNRVFLQIVANRVVDHREDQAYIDQTKQAAEAAAELLGIERVFYGDLPDERLDAPLIDVIVAIEEVVKTVAPDTMLVPSAGDSDQDHRAVASACRVACRGVDTVHAYEVPGPSRGFLPNHYVDIGRYLPAKIQAMSCYEEEMRPYPHPRSELGLECHARFRGMEAGLEFAEAFLVLKQVIRAS